MKQKYFERESETFCSAAPQTLGRFKTNFKTNFAGPGFVISFKKLIVIVFKPKAMTLTPGTTWACCMIVFIINDIFQLSQDKSKS